MKNKKLFTRLFALLASLVLVLALALPCFAEETEQPPTDYIYKRVYSLNDVIPFFINNPSFMSCIIREYYETDTYFFASISYNSSTGIMRVDWSDYTDVDYYRYILSSTDDPDVLSLNVRYDSSNGSSTDTYEISWEEVELCVLVPVSSAPTDSTTPSSDMYSNLFNILKDAVYGSDVELTGSQEYALTLISTILTYATILLPVILVIFIAVWCFKRF